MNPAVDAILRLPAGARRNAVRQIQASLEKGGPSAGERFARARKAMEDATGEPLSLKVRDSRMSWRRAVIAYTMAAEGFTETEIGDQMERDHSTVHNMKTRVADALQYPGMYADVIEILEKFRAYDS